MDELTLATKKDIFTSLPSKRIIRRFRAEKNFNLISAEARREFLVDSGMRISKNDISITLPTRFSQRKLLAKLALVYEIPPWNYQVASLPSFSSKEVSKDESRGKGFCKDFHTHFDRIIAEDQGLKFQPPQI